VILRAIREVFVTLWLLGVAPRTAKVETLIPQAVAPTPVRVGLDV